MGEHAKRRHIRLWAVGLSGTLAAGGLFGLTGTANASSCQRSGTTVTCTFGSPGSPEDFVVPQGLFSAHIKLQGGSGGNGAVLLDATTPTSGQGGPGGGGGITDATNVPLTPGMTLGIYVGSNGSDGTGCHSEAGGIGGSSGGFKTGGNGGAAFPDISDPAACAGGGGGGGSFIMTNGSRPQDILFADTTDDEEDNPTIAGPMPLLVAGGGGGGGGGLDDDPPNAGGKGGGTTSGAAEYGDSAQTGGSPSSELTAVGENGENGNLDEELRNAGGGGGGGFTGGEGGSAFGFASNNPGGGGGGGGHTGFVPEPDVAVVPASVTPGAALSARAPASLTGPVTHDVATAGEPGAITITYTDPGNPGNPNQDTAACTPGQVCAADPPAGQQETFHVVASGGTGNAVLFAILNGGPPPVCSTVPGVLNPDWVQFGFVDPHDGHTWSKRIRVTGHNPMTKTKARKLKRETEICFAAPYKFVPKHDTALTKKTGSQFWEAILPDCNSREIKVAKRFKLKLAHPCVAKRSLVHREDGWVVRVVYKVPKGPDDPQGRSKRVKKKKKRH